MPSTMHSHRGRTQGGRWSRLFCISAIALPVAVVLGACSGASTPFRDAGGVAAPATGGGAIGEAPVPAATAGPADAGATTGGDTSSGSTAGGTGSVVQDVLGNSAYIVKTGSMTLEVPAIDAALLRARGDILGFGGYIAGSQQTNDGDKVLASVTYRLPADKWENALDALRALSTKVIDLKTSSDEVTGQVLDLGARIVNLQATERALQAIMVKATKIQDILDVQNQLTGVRGQIEELSTQLSHLKDQAAMSTLTVLFETPAVPAVKETSKSWDPGTEFDRAVSQLLGLGQGLATAAIWLGVVALPTLLLIALVPLFLAAIVRRIGWLRIHPGGPASIGGGPAA